MSATGELFLLNGPEKHTQSTSRIFREHCSRKLSKLRQKLKLTHGRGREYKKTAPVPTSNLADGQYVQTILASNRDIQYNQPSASSFFYTRRSVPGHTHSSYRLNVIQTKPLVTVQPDASVVPYIRPPHSRITR